MHKRHETDKILVGGLLPDSLFEMGGRVSPRAVSGGTRFVASAIGKIAHLTAKASAAVVVASALCAAMTALADLPSGYRQLDYVDTDGNQWVNTLFVPSCTNAVEIKASILDKLSTSQFLYCTRKATRGTDKRFYSLCIYSSKPRFDYDNGQESGNVLTLGEPYVFTTSPSEDAGQDEVAEASKTWTLTGSGNGSATVSSQNCFTADTDSYFCLFGGYAGSLNDSTSISAKAYCRFWHFKVWDTKDKANLLCHIVPVYSEVHAAIGLYDIVAGRFLPVHGNPFSGKYTLTQDEDWSDEATMLSSGVTVDLAGHSLSAPSSVTKSESSSVAGDGYQDLEFVTAAGAQSVCIPGFRLPGTAKVKMKIRPNAFPTTSTLFFSRTGGSADTFTSIIYGDNASASQQRKIRFDLNNKQSDSSTALTTGNDYVLVFDGTNLSWRVDGEPQAIKTTSNDFTSGTDLRLLNLSANGLYYPAYCRLYYFTVTTNGTVVALDLRPVRRVSDGTVGLYDTVGGAFYESERSPFPDTTMPQYTNTSETVSELRVGQRVIEGYTLVDCITSSGSQYIDTGFVPSSTDYVEIKASLSTGNANRGLFCSRDGNAENSFTAIYSNLNTARFDFNSAQAVTTFGLETNEIFTIALDGNTKEGYVNGEVAHTFTDANDFTPVANLFIFALHKNGSSIGYRPSGNIYHFKVTGADGKLKLDMVPAVRNYDSVPGLYDRISRTFHPSTSGTAFTAGAQAGDGKLYADADCAFDGGSIAANIALVKEGESAFDGRGTTVAGTLRPVGGTVGGVVLQDGATLDLSNRSDAFGLDENAISFANGASISISLGSRNVSSKTPLVSWTTAPSNVGTLTFLKCADGCRLAVKDDGVYPSPKGMMIIVR